MAKFNIEIKEGDLIKYNFLFSNEKEKLGIVWKIEKDLNFTALIHIIANSKIDQVPYNIMEYKILERKNQKIL